MAKPKIRFKGYQEDWEQRKLSEIADKVTEKNKNNDFSEPFTNSAEQGIISQKDYFDREIVNNENLTGYYIVRNNDFIYNPRISVSAPVGPINRNRLSRNGVMSPLYTVFRTHDIDHLYLEFYFKTTRWHRFMKLNGDSGARFDRFTISSTEFMKMPIPYPGIEEQKKIGKYFDNLDHLITLHQRKCDETKKIKKYMLQKMFPQNGKKVPELRFLGFTDDWEQRKFGDLADYKKGPFGSALKKDIFVPKSDTTVKVYEQQNAINKDWHLERYFITEEYANKLSGFRVEGGDIIVSCAGTIGETYEIPMGAEPGIINQALMKIKVKESIVNKKMFNILFTNMIDDFTRVHSNGSAIKNIPPFSDLKPMEVFVPKMDEQNKISSYFRNIDHLITLHQRKYEELQKVKKFMLQNMFV